MASRLAQLVRHAPADVLVVVRIGVGHRRHLDELGAAQAQRVLLLLALRLRDHDQRAVAAGVRDDGEADAGVAGRRLDDEAAGLELAALLGFEDHLPPGAVLHRLAGVHELGLAEDRAAGLLRGAAEPDQRRVADRGDDVVADGHGLEAEGSMAHRLRRKRADGKRTMRRARQAHVTAGLDSRRKSRHLSPSAAIDPATKPPEPA